MKTKSSLKKQAESFKASSKIYYKELEQIAELEKNNPWFVKEGEAGASSIAEKNAHDLYCLMKEDVKFVEDTYNQIEEECGKAAKIMMWNLYVDGANQLELAERFGYSRRQLQYNIKKWMKEVFGAEEEN